MSAGPSALVSPLHSVACCVIRAMHERRSWKNVCTVASSAICPGVFTCGTSACAITFPKLRSLLHECCLNYSQRKINSAFCEIIHTLRDGAGGAGAAGRRAASLVRPVRVGPQRRHARGGQPERLPAGVSASTPCYTLSACNKSEVGDFPRGAAHHLLHDARVLCPQPPVQEECEKTPPLRIGLRQVSSWCCHASTVRVCGTRLQFRRSHAMGIRHAYHWRAGSGQLPSCAGRQLAAARP